MSLADEIVGVLDADVLFPMPLCDTLLLLAKEGQYLPRWSPQILEVRRMASSASCVFPSDTPEKQSTIRLYGSGNLYLGAQGTRRF
jgi:hypothetical protein